MYTKLVSAFKKVGEAIFFHFECANVYITSDMKNDIRIKPKMRWEDRSNTFCLKREIIFLFLTP